MKEHYNLKESNETGIPMDKGTTRPRCAEEHRPSLLKVCASMFLVMLLTMVSYSASAQERMRVSVTVEDATCFNNGVVLFHVTDASGRPLSENENFAQYRNYYKLYEEDSAHYSNYGIDTLLHAPGTLIVGYEAAYWNGTDWELQNFDTLVTIGTNYRVPEASAIYTTSTTLDGYGRRPTLDCMNSGRIQLKIEFGKFPYTVAVCTHGTNDTLRTVTFDTYQNIDESGNLLNTTNTSRYDYKDYYTFDSLAVGDWDFYVTDGCGYGLPRTGQRVEVINFPKLDHINVFSGSNDNYFMVDSNVVKINAILDRNYPYYNFQLPNWVQYRFTYDGLDSSEWKPFPYTTTQNQILYDTVSGAHAYCDLYDRNINFEYKQTACYPKEITKTFKIYAPAAASFKKDSSDYRDSTYLTDVNPCLDKWRYHTDYYTIKYNASYYLNKETANNDHPEIRYHYTHPLTWIYTDTDSNVVIKRDTVGYISVLSYLRASDVEAKYGSFKNRDLYLHIERKLVDGKGCVLYTTNDVLKFIDTIGQQVVDWEMSKNDGDHCCTQPGEIEVYEHHKSMVTPDGTIIRLSRSPYNNKYNFEAVYDRSTLSWTITKDNMENMATVLGDTSGRKMRMLDYCLPSGPYTFDIITSCDTITLTKNYTFPDRYSVEVTEPFSFSQEQRCTDNYLKYETGKISLVKRNTDVNTGLEKTPVVTNLVCQFGVSSGPTGGYDTKYVNVGEEVRISIPGRYILKYTPTSTSGYCGNVVFYDTLDYNGASVDFDYAYALLCDTLSHSGTVYVRGKRGTLPYTYTLYSGPDMTGTPLGINTTGVFPDVPFSVGDELSCHIQDDCSANFHVNITPTTWEKMQLVWFDGGLTEHTTCEGTTVTFHALNLDNVLGYQWSGPDTTFEFTSSDPTIFLGRGAQSGWYKATLLNTGCSGNIADSVYLTVLPTPSIAIGENATVCPGTPTDIRFTPKSYSRPEGTVTFTVAQKTEEGTQYTTLSAPSDSTVTMTVFPMRNTEIFVTSLNDGDCDYTIPEDTVTITVRTDVANSCTLLTTDTTVCFGSDAQLHAKSTMEVPYTLNWYADYAQTSKLKSEYITSTDQWSTYDTSNVRQRVQLYVSVEQDGACPSVNGLPTNTLNMSSGSTTVNCGETYRLYDSGGEEGNYGTNESFKHVFTTDGDDNLQIRFDYLELNEDAKLYLFKGDQPVTDSLLYVWDKTYSVPDVIDIPSDKVLFWFISSLQATGRGWSANISQAKMAVADYKLPLGDVVITATNDILCYNNTAHLTASSDIDYPQHYTWYNNQYEVLFEETVNSGSSHFYPKQQISDSLYYVSVQNDASCPFVPEVNNVRHLLPAYNLNQTMVDTTFLSCRDSIPFYDNGGKNGKTRNINHNPNAGIYYDNICYHRIFKADPGKQVTIHIDTLSLYSYLEIYDGESASGNLLAKLSRQLSNLTYTSTTGALYVRHNSGSGDMGWEGSVVCNCNIEVAFAESRVSIKKPLGEEVITTTNDTVCYNSTAHLTASSDIDYPQYYTWYNDKEEVLFEETVNSGSSHFYPKQQISDSLYYVHVQNEATCPFVSGFHFNRHLLPAYNLNQTTVDTTFLFCGDSIPFYDDGGKNGYTIYGQYYRIFKAEPGRQVTIHFDTLDLYLDPYSLEIYDGESASGNLLAKLGGHLSNLTYTSTTGALYVRHASRSGDMGWEGSVVCNCNIEVAFAESRVSIREQLANVAITATNDTVCYNSTAHLTASSDIDYPQHYTWYNDQYEVLFEETVNSGLSHFYPEHQISDTIYYVYVNNDASCPFVPEIHNTHKWVGDFLMNSSQNGKTTTLASRDSLNFYDSGGKTGDYMINEDYYHTFKAEPGTEVVLELTSFNCESPKYDWMCIYDGTTPSASRRLDSLGGDLRYSMPRIYTSTTGSLTIRWRSDDMYPFPGWEGSITTTGPALTKSHVSIKKPLGEEVITTTNDTVCYNSTAHLTASSDIDYPQYYTWYNDKDEVLFEETVESSGVSNFYPENQVCDSLYFVRVQNDASCPFVPEFHTIRHLLPAYNLNQITNTTFLTCGDSIPFYDEGGKQGDTYSYLTYKSCLFKAEPGKQITIHIDTMSTAYSLEIYDGESSYGCERIDFYRKNCTQTYTSTNGALYVQNYSEGGYMGWEGSVVCNCNTVDFAESRVSIKKPLGEEVITTTNDTVCYNSTAHLTASSDIDYPQYYTWYNDKEEVLFEETVNSGSSHFYPEQQISDSLYYVHVHNEATCPFVPGFHFNRHLLPAYNLNQTTVDTTFLFCGDSIPFYDDGGKNGYTIYGQYYRIFKAEPGRQVTIHFDTLDVYLDPYSLKIYDGESAAGNLLANLYGKQGNLTFTSTTGTLYVYFNSLGYDMGWEGSVVCNCDNVVDLAEARVYLKRPLGKKAITTTNDTVCYDNTAHLTATSDIDYPQSFTWYNEHYEILYQDIVDSGSSHFYPEHQISDSLYYVSVNNDGCPYFTGLHNLQLAYNLDLTSLDLAESHVSIRKPLGKDAITASNDTVCNDNTAHLTASSNIDYPQHFTWYNDQYEVVFEETVESGSSHFHPEHQVSDSLYFVRVQNDVSCPFLPEYHIVSHLLPDYNLGPRTRDTIFLSCGDSIPFYDIGGKNGTTGGFGGGGTQVFKAEPGKQVTIHIDTLSLKTYSSMYSLYISDDRNNSTSLYGNKANLTFTSTTGTIYVQHINGNNDMGWEGSVVCNCNHVVDLAESRVSIKGSGDVKMVVSDYDFCPKASSETLTATFSNVSDTYGVIWVIGNDTVAKHLNIPNTKLVDTIHFQVPSTVSCGNDFEYHIIYLCDNGCDSVSETKHIRITDNEKPQITGALANLNVTGCVTTDVPVPATSLSELSGITVTDNCSTEFTLLSKDSDPVGDCAKTVVRSYIVQDGCGNADTIYQNIVFTPDVTMTGVPADNGSEVGSIEEAVAPGAPNATDACGTTVVPTYNSATDSVINVLAGHIAIAHHYHYINCMGIDSEYVYTYIVHIPLTISSGNCEDVYDGKDHTCEKYEVTYNGIDVPECLTCTPDSSAHEFILPTGDTVTVYNPIVLHNVDSVPNTFDYEITHSDRYSNVDTSNGGFEIVKLPITITAVDSTKLFDELPLTVDSAYVSAGTLADGETLADVTVTGSITDPGTTDNIPSAAVIKHGDEDVTSNYDITYANGTLTVVPPQPIEVLCPNDTMLTLNYNDCGMFVEINAPEILGDTAGLRVVVNSNAPIDEYFVAGTTVVTWTVTDKYGRVVECHQNVTINFPPCEGTVTDFDGYEYDVVRIGCQCWTGQNARSTHYSDGAEVRTYTSYNGNDSLEGVYGKLYNWYATVRVPEGDDSAAPADSLDIHGNPYVQGICPEGWTVPTEEEYLIMLEAAGGVSDKVKEASALYWLPDREGTLPNSGFNARGAGYYDGGLGRYYNLLGQTNFWTIEGPANSSSAKSFVITHYCNEGLIESSSKGIGYSVRCLRKK